jgi:hypothetical protein
MHELTSMNDNGFIDKDILEYLKPYMPKVGRFYPLPKIRNENNPNTPIVSVKLLCLFAVPFIDK